MEITLTDLKKTYKSKDSTVCAVNGISLNIPSNKIFGIIGKSGAGKSSLVRLVSLLEQPDEGSVCFDGVRVDNLSKKELIQRRRRIGMIFQNFNLFSSRTAARNIAYPMEICGFSKSQIKERVAQMLSLVGLEDRGAAPVSTLSGGQKQRIAIARALSTNPDILFCDEATSALDPQTTRSILNLIRDIQKKMNLTVVMITHQMEVVRDACDEVAVIDSGKVVEQGKVSDIFSHPKSPVTKDFISHIGSEKSSESSSLNWSKKSGGYVLHFLNESSEKPVLSQMVKKFNIDVNLFGAEIYHLSESNVGTMRVDLTGDESEIQKAILWLKENNVIAEANNE